MATVICGKNVLSKASNLRFIYSLQRMNSTSSSNQAEEATKASPLPKNEYYDIVVVGGGMVGTAMAKALG